MSDELRQLIEWQLAQSRQALDEWLDGKAEPAKEAHDEN